jgi:hypothetical protein
MEEFDLEPGPAIGTLLKKAYMIYDREPCSREDILRKLREEIEKERQ